MEVSSSLEVGAGMILMALVITFLVIACITAITSIDATRATVKKEGPFHPFPLA